ncbi:MAG: hypothetical protein HY720_13565, partial [Planctomycetes bacterium]|nr:hypothetical protein [Planctomycetota bacterium]
MAMTRFMGRLAVLLLVVAAAAAGFLPRARAQSREELEKLLGVALPDGRPVRFEYTVKSNLAGDRYVSLEAEGTFEGRTRLAFDFRSNQWPASRKAAFLATETRVAFRETPPPLERDSATPDKDQPDAWKLYQANEEKEREPAYASLLLPQQFVRDVSSYAGAYEEAGSCGIGQILCQAHEGVLAEDRILTLFALYGFVTGPQDEVIEKTGMVTLWVGKEDGLLRGAELVLSAKIKKAPENKDPGGNGGGAPA